MFTREETKKLLPIIQAFAEGKTIQVRINNDSSWTDLLDDKLEISNLYEYRIKPEPKYRPFKSQEECWNEMHKHPDFGWLKSKERDEIGVIGRVLTLNGKVLITWSTNEGLNIEVSEIFTNYTFTDGTPFGIKE